MEFKINLQGTNIDLTPAIRDYAEEKVRSVEKYIGNTESTFEILADVHVGTTTGHHHSGDIFKAETVLMYDGKKFVAISEKDDLYAAIDEMQSELEREIISKKEKDRTLFRRGGAIIKKALRRGAP